jgi:hypothetical protein
MFNLYGIISKMCCISVDYTGSSLCAILFQEYYLENDPTCLYQAAQAIMTLQSLFGVIPRVSGKGPAAKQVWDLMCRMARERQGAERPGHMPQSQIDHLLLLDRGVDLLTPLATQLTYEGLIDEIFGINNSKCMIHIMNFEFQLIIESCCQTSFYSSDSL